MDIDKFFQALPQFLILLPGAASCYLPAKNRMKYSPAKTAALFMAAILPFSIAAALLCTLFSIDVNVILLLSLVPFFFQLAISALLFAAFVHPATHYFRRTVDSPGFSKIWYCTVALSSMFFILNVLAVPRSYSTLHAGRML